MTLIWSALTIGAVYALVATGYNIVFTASGRSILPTPPS